MKTAIKITNRLFSVLLITILVLACSKDGEDGAVGPQGAQGEQGPPGPQGEAGEDGVDGETGTANVIYSDWIPSEFDDGNINAIVEGFNIDAPALTNDIKNNGTILVYGRNGNGENAPVYALPVTFGHMGYQSYYYWVNEGTIQIIVQSTDGNDIVSTLFDDYRYVLIPGGSSASSKSSSKDYTKMSYQEIAAHFNIPN